MISQNKFYSLFSSLTVRAGWPAVHSGGGGGSVWFTGDWSCPLEIIALHALDQLPTSTPRQGPVMPVPGVVLYLSPPHPAHKEPGQEEAVCLNLLPNTYMKPTAFFLLPKHSIWYLPRSLLPLSTYIPPTTCPTSFSVPQFEMRRNISSLNLAEDVDECVLMC